MVSARSHWLDIHSTLMDSVSIMQDRAATPVTQDINARIASRVRTLRTDHGMTLDALAAKCDVSRSMISLVERGESSPTAVFFGETAPGLRPPPATPSPPTIPPPTPPPPPTHTP